MVSQIKKKTKKHFIWSFYSLASYCKKIRFEILNPLTPIQLSLDRIKSKIIDDDNSKKHFF